ncbi:hypothetical protein B0H17DRAFT_571275 [Mycena rosella]|uniref:Uncharacterized protein n=1 Tax=Mycena rosella TaxID=1033263 RepID=A0AAD7GWQ2_MYCRO|nr:hypothetical protein B0H17DRAFT_571275 [Mycena rosella]
MCNHATPGMSWNAWMTIWLRVGMVAHACTLSTLSLFPILLVSSLGRFPELLRAHRFFSCSSTLSTTYRTSLRFSTGYATSSWQDNLLDDFSAGKCLVSKRKKFPRPDEAEPRML